MLEAALAAGIASGGGDAMTRRRAADAGRLDPGPPARLRPRRGRLRLAQPLRRQRDQVLRRAAGPSSTTTPRPRSRRAWTTRRRPSTPAPSRELEGAFDDYLRELRTRLHARPLGPQDRARLRQRRHLPRRARRSSSGSAPRSTRSRPSPTGATSTTAAAPPRPRRLAERVKALGRRDRLRLRRRRRPPDRGRRRTATIHDGDELIALAARAPARAGELARRRRGHGDDQLRLPPGDGGRRHRDRPDPGRRPLRDARRCASATGTWAASSPATSSGPTSRPPATASPPRCSPCARSATASSRTSSRSSACPRGWRT